MLHRRPLLPVWTEAGPDARTRPRGGRFITPDRAWRINRQAMENDSRSVLTGLYVQALNELIDT